MFEDRSKNYDFKKLDKIARTQVLVENEKNIETKSQAHQKLFSTQNKKSNQQNNQSVLNTKHDLDLKNLPSSNYLKNFENMVAGETEIISESTSDTSKEILPEVEKQNKTISDVNFESLIEEAKEINIENKNVQKELKNISKKPQKSFSFRIKLVLGVYCILVALFGGWIITNSVEIAQTNSNIYEASTESTTVNNNIAEIVLKIKNYDDASKDPSDQSVWVQMSEEIIQVTPQPINEPQNYEKESNWFDVFCNWISKIFGGK